jgi:hypothetical protein
MDNSLSDSFKQSSIRSFFSLASNARRDIFLEVYDLQSRVSSSYSSDSLYPPPRHLSWEFLILDP